MRAVVVARLRSLLVAFDVAADPPSRVVELFVLVQLHLPFFEFPEPALDEGLALGVAVAAASVLDSELGEPRAKAASGEGGPVIRAECQLAWLDRVDRGGAFDQRDRFVGAATQLKLPAD